MIYWMICLLILTSQHIHSKVITVNPNGGNDSEECCLKGECPCSLLATALQRMTSNTVVNITSQSVALNSTVTMGLGHLTNITISGNGAIIMCNDSGSVCCDWCNNMIIDGVVWDRCGYGNDNDLVAGVSFNNTSANITIVNCSFQNSEAIAINLSGVYENVLVKNCNFDNSSDALYIAGNLNFNHSVNLSIQHCNFYKNGCSLSCISNNDNPYASSLVAAWNIAIVQTNFEYNLKASYMNLGGSDGFMVVLKEVVFHHNANIFDFNGGSNTSGRTFIFQILHSSFSGNTGFIDIYTHQALML